MIEVMNWRNKANMGMGCASVFEFACFLDDLAGYVKPPEPKANRRVA